jgi:hypothetical protein
MNRYGGCFAPHSLVRLEDGTHSEIQSLWPGVRVWGGASVVHVVRMNYDAVVPMVILQSDAGECAPRQRLQPSQGQK